MPLRIDPNGGWTVETTRRVLPALAADGLLEYLEDPVSTLQEMGAVAKFANGMPLATNMVTIAFGHIPESVRLGAVQVILSDHHYWGGLRATQQLAAIGRTFGIGISMHSNSHLGISLAAMTHVGVTIPNLQYACDTHYPWQVDEVITGGKLQIRDGQLAPPPGHGLGVTLDREQLARLHRNYLNAASACVTMPGKCASTSRISTTGGHVSDTPNAALAHSSCGVSGHGYRCHHA